MRARKNSALLEFTLVGIPLISTSRRLMPARIFSMWGMFYQPRGAGLVFQGHGAFTAPVSLITGYLSLQGGASLNLQKQTAPPRRIVALIE